MNGDSEVEVISLRDIPGVSEVEALLEAAERSPSGKWSREYEQAQKLADAISKRIFGIVEADTRYVDDDRLSRFDNDQLGGNWEACFRDYGRNNMPNPNAPWAELYWDVTDGNGNPLRALELFWRQIVATEHGLCGHTPGYPADEMDDQEAAAVERKLQEEASKFRPKR